jgi:biotin transport system substrate-specific component
MLSLTFRRMHSSIGVKVLSVLLFAVVTGLSARISVLLPFSPVPLTLQVLVVVLSGLVLGSRAGLGAQVLYLQAILLGAPLTASGLAGPAAFVAPTAGYLLAFPCAAAVAGWMSHRPASVKPLWRALGGLAALTVIYALGMAWLSGFVGGLKSAWTLGVLPFIGADTLKIVIATAVLSLRDR